MKSFLAIIFLCLLSCTSRLPDRELLTREFYTKQVLDHSMEKDKACIERAIASAGVYVDSLVDQWINEDLLDTIKFPPKPLKPEAPDPIIGTVDRFNIDSTARD